MEIRRNQNLSFGTLGMKVKVLPNAVPGDEVLFYSYVDTLRQAAHEASFNQAIYKTEKNENKRIICFKAGEIIEGEVLGFFKIFASLYEKSLEIVEAKITPENFDKTWENLQKWLKN